MRTIAVVTVGRSDYGIILPVLRRIQEEGDLQLHLIVSGMHLSPEFGLTVRDIEADGFRITERVEMLLSSDSAASIAKAIGIGTIGFAQVYSRFRPDLLVVLGDRFEMYAAALAALPFKIPVAHIHGGELTEGAIDDTLRHSMTKLSHLHFVATEEYARRVRQLGEEPWRVTVSGAPGLDLIRGMSFLSKEELESRFDLDLLRPPILLTFHPVTMEYERTEWQTGQLIEALRRSGLPVIFTLPNADTAGRTIMALIRECVATCSWAKLVANLGSQGYLSLMRQALMMVGNSSSGLIEAPSFGLPVVNIGSRQGGRVRGQNVIDVGYNAEEILGGIERAASPAFKASLAGLPNPYGDQHAADRIVRVLREVRLGDHLFPKRFHDLPGLPPAPTGGGGAV